MFDAENAPEASGATESTHEGNQCDGCLRGLPVVEGIHYDGKLPYMTCSANLYDPVVEIAKAEAELEQAQYLAELPADRKWPATIHPFPPCEHTFLLHERVERKDGTPGRIRAVYSNGLLVRFEDGACYTVRPGQIKSAAQVLQ
jgi:hypothetical protein